MASSNPGAAWPTVLVVLGATGDLMERKIVPALFSLFSAGQLPGLFQLVGFSRRPWDTKQFQAELAAIIRRAGPGGNAGLIEKFIKNSAFVSGRFEAREDYRKLGAILGKSDKTWRVCANKLFYLATPPEHYATIFRELNATKLTAPCGPEEGWTRVLVEKPFGKNLRSARRLDQLLARLFKEDQIYRIDHYLAKEMLQNILAWRFSNNLLESNWHHRAIESINIRLWEDIGVEERGHFYDGVGALRDVGQNHLLQMLALVTMEAPSAWGAKEIRAARANLLSDLIPLRAAEVARRTWRAQYNGYQRISGVAPNSTTETYFRVPARLKTPRWRGVNIWLESGKRLGESRKEIQVVFRHPQPCLCPPGSSHRQNAVLFQLEPREGIKIQFWSKQPGWEFVTEERALDFSWRAPAEPRQYIAEYSKLLLDCFHGDQTSFISTAEVQAMWRFTDPLSLAWQRGPSPLHHYRPNSAAVAAEAERVLAADSLSHRAIGFIGLGKMGSNLARRLHRQNWQVVGFNRSPGPTRSLTKEGVTPAFSLAELVKQLPRPRLIWLMVPAGLAVDALLTGSSGLVNHLERGDTVIDGGNSFYKDSIKRAKHLERRGINYIDVGVSGGPAGALGGACLMIGGQRPVFERLEPLWQAVAGGSAYQWFPGAGAGHFVKMIHNGVEYGMMQALAEGFAILKRAPFQLNLTDVSYVYNNGSVIESRLVGWLQRALLAEGQNLRGVSGQVEESGEAAWTVQTAQELKVKNQVIKAALQFRRRSRRHPDFTGQILSALRGQFGGH